MTTLRCLALLALLLVPLPAAAQEEQCIEVWEMWADDMRHEVNLDTGRVTSYESTVSDTPYGVVDSPDGRYSAHIDWEPGKSDLVLTDFDRGVTVTLAENAGTLAWSPDGSRLAYVQLDTEHETKYLVLYDMDTGTHLSNSLPENARSVLPLAWSADGSFIAAPAVVDQADGRSDVLLYDARSDISRHILIPHFQQQRWSGHLRGAI